MCMSISLEEVNRIADQIHEVMNECIKMVPKAEKYESIVQAVVWDLLKAYKDILLLYMYLGDGYGQKGTEKGNK
jgi:hypothetical protein